VGQLATIQCQIVGGIRTYTRTIRMGFHTLKNTTMAAAYSINK
jgi:hypothetical protein